MVIYHLFFNGRYWFKTNSFEEVLDAINDRLNNKPTVDFIVDGLISKHEYHYFDFDGNRKIDIVASTIGE